MKPFIIQCRCGAKLFFQDDLLSQYENFDGSKHNKKPLEVETGEVHECPIRGWSHSLKCKTCSGLIRFNNAITSLRTGRKIPHGIDGKRHVCVRTL